MFFLLLLFLPLLGTTRSPTECPPIQHGEEKKCGYIGGQRRNGATELYCPRQPHPHCHTLIIEEKLKVYCLDHHLNMSKTVDVLDVTNKHIGCPDISDQLNQCQPVVNKRCNYTEKELCTIKMHIIMSEDYRCWEVTSYVPWTRKSPPEANKAGRNLTFKRNATTKKVSTKSNRTTANTTLKRRRNKNDNGMTSEDIALLALCIAIPSVTILIIATIFTACYCLQWKNGMEKRPETSGVQFELMFPTRFRRKFPKEHKRRQKGNRKPDNNHESLEMTSGGKAKDLKTSSSTVQEQTEDKTKDKKTNEVTKSSRTIGAILPPTEAPTASTQDKSGEGEKKGGKKNNSNRIVMFKPPPASQSNLTLTRESAEIIATDPTQDDIENGDKVNKMNKNNNETPVKSPPESSVRSLGTPDATV